MFEERDVFRLFESFAWEALQTIDLIRSISDVTSNPDFESFLKVRKVDIIVKTIIVQLVEYRSSYLVWFESDPIERR